MRVLAWSLFLLAVSGCEETLPVYQPPEHVLATSLYQNLSFKDLYGADWDVIDFSAPPQSGLLRTFYVALVNEYEETFEDSVDITGDLRLWFEGSQYVGAVIPIRTNSPWVAVVTYGMIRANMFRIFPGDTFLVKVVWDGNLTDGTPAWVRAQHKIASSVLLSPTEQVNTTSPVEIRAEARLRVFKRMQTIPTNELNFQARFRWHSIGEP